MSDLSAIYSYICASTSPAASKWFDGLLAEISSLYSLPDRGTLIYSHRSNRRILFGRKPHFYRIVYRVDHSRDIVLIQRVEHGAKRIVP